MSVLLALWLGYATVLWFSPYFLARGARAALHVPGWLALRCQKEGILLLESDRFRGDGRTAFSCFLGFRRAIVCDAQFLRFSLAPPKTFVVAHELAHHLHGHAWKRFLCVAFFGHLLPAGRRWIAAQERQADQYASWLTGIDPGVLCPITVIHAAAPRRGISTEESES